jgi:uncharacterized protein
MTIPRTMLATQIESALADNPIVAIIGPRQCGKTTLAREIAARHNAIAFDLEHPADALRLQEPMTALGHLSGLVVIDEAQLQPALFPALRVLVDRPPLPARFLLLGSASPELSRNISETLAGRLHFVEMGGFTMGEAGRDNWRRLWLRGGFPRSFIARTDEQSFTWREDFTATFLERDLRRFGIQAPPAALRRLWMMIAHYHGQTCNFSDLGRSLAESHTTIRQHLDILTGALMLRQLQPWHENIGKRQVKSPKIYVRDSGILHFLLGLATSEAVESHPKLGASWEGFVIERIVHFAGERNCTFWATQAGAELDLLVFRRGKKFGFEVKYSDAPATTKSMRVALADLALEKLFVIYPGSGGSFRLDDKIHAVAIRDLEETLDSL